MIPIWREKDARSFNSVVNDPDVYPDLSSKAGPIDLTVQLADDRNYCLCGTFGGCLFNYAMPGLYEVHTAVRADGRGEWARALADAVLWWMFINTDAWEIATRVPEGHTAAKALTLRAGMRHDFITTPGAIWRGKLTPMHTYTLHVSEWIRHAEGLVQHGEWLHKRMAEEALRLGVKTPPHDHADDAHYRYAGACAMMASVGQLTKGVSLYNRWAILARHRPVFMTGAPDAIRMDLGIMHFVGDDIEILPCN